jgi:hypothetical protein
VRIGQFKKVDGVFVEVAVLRDASGGLHIEVKALASLVLVRHRTQPDFIEAFADWACVFVARAVRDLEFH